MSFDEKQYIGDDKIDLAELFRSIWFYKFSLLIFITLSLPVSVMYSTSLVPKYKAETVFEKPRNPNMSGNTSLLSNAEGFGFLDFLSGGPIGGSLDSFFSEIRSASFLKTVLLNNPELDNRKLKRICPLPAKSDLRFSLRSLLTTNNRG